MGQQAGVCPCPRGRGLAEANGSRCSSALARGFPERGVWLAQLESLVADIGFSSLRKFPEVGIPCGVRCAYVFVTTHVTC